MRTLAAFVVLAFASIAPALATPAANMSRMPAVESAIVQVQSRSCRACRNSCSIDRRYCGYSMSCRREFTACMRMCWEDVCR